MTWYNKLEQLSQLLMSTSLIINNAKLEIDIAEVIEIIDKNSPELINEITNQSSWEYRNTENKYTMINSKNISENLYWNEGNTWRRYIMRPRLRPRFRTALSLIDSSTIDNIILNRN